MYMYMYNYECDNYVCSVYRIAGNLCGYKFLRFGKINEFCGFNFCDSSPRISGEVRRIWTGSRGIVVKRH